MMYLAETFSGSFWQIVIRMVMEQVGTIGQSLLMAAIVLRLVRETLLLFSPFSIERRAHPIK